MKQKTRLLLCFLLYFTGVSHGQYLPIVEEGKYWILQQYSADDIPYPIAGYAISFSGDTVVNTLNYKKVYRSTLRVKNQCAPTAANPCYRIERPYRTLNRVLIAFIREDSLKKKVYSLPISLSSTLCQTETEHLILDYSLEIGDSLNLCVYEAIGGGLDFGFETFGIVDSLGTINLYNRDRRTIYTTGYTSYLGLPPAGQIRMLEGIGLENYGVFHDASSILIDFCEGGIEFCELLSPTTTIKKIQSVNIFPNPSKGVYQIDLPSNFLESIRIYTKNGVFKGEIRHSKTIDLSNLQNGVYLLELVDRSGGRLMRKVVKQN